jgi:hypothetical protein
MPMAKRSGTHVSSEMIGKFFHPFFSVDCFGSSNMVLSAKKGTIAVKKD